MTSETNAAAAEAVPASSPEQLMALFGQRVHDRDLEALMQLYEPDAVFHPTGGDVLTGSDEIRAGLAALLALKPSMNVEVAEVMTSGDTALIINEWSMTGTAPNGSEVSQGGTSADVLRRQSDGSWRVLIDHP